VFKVGDKVKRVVDCGYWSKYFGEVGKEYTVLSLNRYGNIQVIPENQTDDELKYAAKENFELVADYEDDWVLVKSGVTVPEGADVSLSQAGHVVAFRPLKKPRVVEYIRYAGRGSNTYATSAWKNESYPNKIVFIETDGVLTDIRWEK